MKIDFYWKHMDTPPRAEDYALQKFGKLDKYLHKFISAHMTTEVNGSGKKSVKLTIHGDGEDFVAHVEDEDVFAAIDRLEEKLGTQLRRHHSKTAKHH